MAKDEGITKVTAGVRTTAETFEDRRAAAFAEAQREDFSGAAQRATEAGPDPYALKTVEDVGKNVNRTVKGKDAEVAIPGTTLDDTGAKIETNPDRTKADSYMEQPATEDAATQATRTAPEGALTADRNPGSSIFGAEIARDEEQNEDDEEPARDDEEGDAKE